jgi:hypothetical protein
VPHHPPPAFAQPVERRYADAQVCEQPGIAHVQIWQARLKRQILAPLDDPVDDRWLVEISALRVPAEIVDHHVQQRIAARRAMSDQFGEPAFDAHRYVDMRHGGVVQ